MPDPYYKTKTWELLRTRVLRRDRYKCNQCGAYANIVDHITSRRAGGSDEPENLRTLCRLCDNQIKEDETGQRRSGGTIRRIGANSRGVPVDPNHHWNRGE